MASPPTIVVKDLHKSFRLPHDRHTSLKQTVLNLGHRRSFEDLKILDGINFEVQSGEFFGIVGRNGCGKSTLLKVLASIYAATSGVAHINGQLTPFIELGVGFNPELTGRDNVFLNGAIFGMPRKEVERKYDEIVAFAELEKFMDQKLKNYSSGMQVRLAFSIAVQARSEVLLIDEVLAVGDAIFQQKCFKYFKELKKQGKTVVFVSHDINSLQEYCDRGVLIERGKMIEYGPIGKVVKAYLSLLNATEAKSEGEVNGKRWGQGGIFVENGGTAASDGKSQDLFTEADDMILIKVSYRAEQTIEEPVYGITITDSSGQRIFQSNTMWTSDQTATINKDEISEVEWLVPNVFNSGDFFIAPAVADRSGATIYDWHDDFITFRVRKQVASSGQVNVKHEVNVKPPRVKASA